MHDAAFIEHFWSTVDRTAGHGPDGDCWIWTGARAGTGGNYGRARVGRKSRPAGQVAWEIENNQAFPTGLNACHSCDNPPCVRPSHIWPGTQGDNVRDCVAKGRHASVRLTQCQRGHPMTDENRVPTTGGWRCRECKRAAWRRAARKQHKAQRCKKAEEQGRRAAEMGMPPSVCQRIPGTPYFDAWHAAYREAVAESAGEQL